MSKPADPKRLRKIKRLLELGVSKAKIARDLGISRQRLYEILNTIK